MTDKNKKPRVLTKKHVARLERERKQVTIVRTVAIVMFVIIAILLGYGYVDIKYLQLQKPVVEVNGTKITVEQWQERVQLERVNLVNLYQRYQFFQQNFGMDVTQQIQEVQFYLSSGDALGQRVIDQMVDDLLVEQEAQKLGITVSEDDLEKAIQESYQYFPNGTPTPTITPTTIKYPTLSSIQMTLYPPTATATVFVSPTLEFTATTDPSATSTESPTETPTAGPPTPTFVPEDVTATPTPYTFEGFKTDYQTIVDQYNAYGISEETLRNAYRIDLLRSKVEEAVTSDQPASEEQVWARHILLEDQSTADMVARLLKQGGNFAELAKEYSKDTATAVDGGELGWHDRSYFVPQFSDAAFSQPIGEIGEIVQTQFGFHIIQVIDRAEIPLTNMQLQQKRDSAFLEWLTNTRESAEIVTYDSWQSLIPPMPDFTSQ